MRPSKIPQSGPAALAARGDDKRAAVAAAIAAEGAGLEEDSSDKFNGSNRPIGSMSCLFSETKRCEALGPVEIDEDGKVKADAPVARAASTMQLRIMVMASVLSMCFQERRRGVMVWVRVQ